MCSNIWIIRHGERFDFIYPQWFNTAVRRYDPPLSANGKIQADKLGEKLKTESIDVIIASPFLRTIQTAHIIADRLNLDIKLEAGLGEWHNPDWMNETPIIHDREELAYFYPRIDWSYKSQIIPQYPETEKIVLQRMTKITQIFIKKFSGNLLLIGHSMSVIGITKALVNNDIDIKPSFCSLTKIVNKKNQWELDLNNHSY